MAEKIVSPGVFTKEIDASFLPAAIGEIGAAVVGPTVKGPAMVPTVVESYQEYQAIFGDVFKSGSSYQTYLTSVAAQQYLRHSGKLTVVRILDGDFGGAEASVPSTGSATLTGGTTSSGSITLNTATTDFELEAEFQITVGATEYRWIVTDGTDSPADSSPLFFFASASGVGSAEQSLANLTASINTAAVGVTVYDGAGASVPAGRPDYWRCDSQKPRLAWR